MAQGFRPAINTCVWFAILVTMAALEKFLRSVCLLIIIRALGIPTLSRALQAQRGRSAFCSDPRERDDPPTPGHRTQVDSGSWGTPNVFPTVLADSTPGHPKDLLNEFQDRPPTVLLDGARHDPWSPSRTSRPDTLSTTTAQDVADSPHHPAPHDWNRNDANLMPDDSARDDEDDFDVDGFYAMTNGQPLSPHGLHFPEWQEASTTVHHAHDYDSYDLAELSGPLNAQDLVTFSVEGVDAGTRMNLEGPLPSRNTEAGARRGECRRPHRSRDLGSDELDRDVAHRQG